MTIEAGNTVSFDGVRTNNFSSGAFSFVGNLSLPAPEFTKERFGGDITIKAGRVILTNGAELNASTFAQGNAGSVFVQADD